MVMRDLTVSEMEVSEADDVSMMGQDPQTEVATGPHGGMAGVGTWDDVMGDELAAIAANIARNAMPSAIGLELGSTSDSGPRFSTRAIDDSNADPLGFGRMDVQNLTMIRSAGRAGGANSGGNLTAVQRLMSTAGGSAPRDSVQASGLPPGIKKGDYAKIRNKVLPTSEQFDPYAYLGIMHRDTTVGELVEGTQHLRTALGEQTASLKSLVRENFERFISCKTTIDDIHSGLQRAEGGGGDGTNTNEVLGQLKEVHQEATRAFLPLLERQRHIRGIHDTQQLMGRYDLLLRLPSRLRKHAEQQDYAQVITEYQTARALQTGLAKLQQGDVWQSLFDEVDRVLDSLCADLVSSLDAPGLGGGDALQVCRHVLQLQAEGLGRLQGVDPVALYLGAAAGHGVKDMEAAQVEHAEEAQGASTEAEAEAGSAATGRGSGQPSGSGSRAPSQQSQQQGSGGGQPMTRQRQQEHDVTLEVLLVRHVQRLTDLMVANSANLWYITQERLSTLPGIGASAASVVAAVPDNTGVAISQLMAAYKSHVLAAIRRLAGCPAVGPATHLLHCLALAADAYSELEARQAPGVLLVDLQEVVAAAAPELLGHVNSYLSSGMNRLQHVADQVLAAAAAAGGSMRQSSNARGSHDPRMPARMRDMLASGMDTLDAAQGQGRKVGISALLSHEAMRTAFYDAFVQFTLALDRMASDTSCDSSGAGQEARNKRTLLLLSAAHQVRMHVYPDLVNRYHGSLFNEHEEALLRTMGGDVSQDVRTVEARLMMAYKEGWQAPLDQALEDYFFGDGTMWDGAPLPRGVRDAAVDLLSQLTQLEAQVFTYVPHALDEVMPDMVARLFQVFPTVLSSQLQNCSSGGLLQLWLEVHYFAAALQRFVNKQVESVLDNVKAALWDRIDRAEAHTAAQRGRGKSFSLMEWIQSNEERLLEDCLTRTRLNTRCFAPRAA